MEKSLLDVFLVPLSFCLMLGYHLVLLYRILQHPRTTVIGYENHNKMAWVERMMQVPSSTGNALAVISGNITAATFLASVCMSLSSLMGTWIGSSTLSSMIFTSSVIYGDTSSSTACLKFVTLLTCFLLAFTFFVQSARHFVHANFLISTPLADIPVGYVQRAVIRGSNFWCLGLRALYFATNLLFWLFGPIPMLVSSVCIVAILNVFDTNSTPLVQFGPIEDLLLKQRRRRRPPQAADYDALRHPTQMVPCVP